MQYKYDLIMIDSSLWLKCNKKIQYFCLFVASIILMDAVLAQSVEDELYEITVWGRESDLIGMTDSASEGIIGKKDLDDRPLFRVGELFEYIPGMVAVSHSGGGKANQYFLRGINLDHGSDFAMNFEGMPVNLRSHAHGNGYLDAHFIIPELVKTMSYTKGTHLAEMGDFSSVGTATFETVDHLDAGIAKLTLGSHNYRRLMAADSWGAGAGELLLGVEIKNYDGPWIVPEDTQLFNLFTKYRSTIMDMHSEMIVTFFSNEWTATDQIPLRAVRSKSISRYGAIDPSQGGKTHRFNLISNLTDGDTEFTGYISNYSLNLFANPTYFLNDTVNGDQIEQEDDRWIVGGKYNQVMTVDFFSRENNLDMGIEFQYDTINDLNLFNAKARNRLSSIREDELKEFSLGMHFKIETNWNERLRTFVGYRMDYYSWNVLAKRVENSGKGSDTLLSPKLDIVYLLNNDWEFTFNYGQGFHSNDVRASELNIDPITNESVTPYDALISTKGWDIGFRGNVNEKLNASLSYFHLDMDSALLYVGDVGTTEPAEGINVTGVEGAIYWKPKDNVMIDVTLAKNKAKIPGLPKNKNFVPDAHDFVASLSAILSFQNDARATIKLRHLGDAPLIEDKSKSKEASTIVNMSLNYPFMKIVVELNIFNILDKELNDIEYFYESRLMNELSSVEDYHFHPSNGREYRLTLGYNF